MHLIALVWAVELTIADGIVTHAFTVVASKFEIGTVSVHAANLVRSIAAIVLEIASPPSGNTPAGKSGVFTSN